MLSPQPADRGLRRDRHPPDPLPPGAGRRRARRRLQPDPPRPAQRGVRGPGRTRHRERLPRHRPGLFRERADADPAGGPGAGEAVPPPDLRRVGGLRAGHQMVGPGARGRRAARDDAPRLPGDADRQGGPVLVEVPAEVWEEALPGELDYEPVVPQRAAPDPAALQKAAEMLAAAENPVLWAGQGVLYAGASDALVRLAELVPAPVVATNPGKSAMPENHPLACGSSTRSGPKMLFEFLRRADLVLAVGSSLTRTPFGPAIPPGKTIVHSTNDPDDIHKDYRADHALVGDAKLVLDGLIERVGALRRANGGAPLAGRNLGRGRRGQGGLARRVGRRARFGRGADQPVPDHPRPDGERGPRQRHNHPRFGEPARAAAADVGDHGARFLYRLGQVDPARLQPRGDHGRQARRARQALHQRDGRRRDRHDRDGPRDRRQGPDRDPHHRAQQRHHGRRARRIGRLRREIRRDDGRRQLHQGGRGAGRAGGASGGAGRLHPGAGAGDRGDGRGSAVSDRVHGEGGAEFFAVLRGRYREAIQMRAKQPVKQRLLHY